MNIYNLVKDLKGFLIDYKFFFFSYVSESLKLGENDVIKEFSGVVNATHGMLETNYTEDPSTSLPIDDSPLPKKEPLEMLAKAGN